MIFQTTNAPMPVLFPFITTWSSIYTLFAQQALFFTSSPLSLSWSVMAPGAMDSTEIFEKDLWCDCTQYGGLVTGEVTGEWVSCCCWWPAGDVLVSSASLLAAPPAGALPFMLPLLGREIGADSIHLRIAATTRRVRCSSEVLWVCKWWRVNGGGGSIWQRSGAQ